MFGFDGAIATAPIARFGIASVNGIHVTPPSVVFHAPPPALPTTAVPATVGSVAMLSVRPAPFVGPRLTQALPLIASDRILGLRSKSVLNSRVRRRSTSASMTPLSP